VSPRARSTANYNESAPRNRRMEPQETAGPSTPLRSGRDDNSSAQQQVPARNKNCHPDRSVPGFPATRNSPAATCAAFSEESRMKFANATNLHRKSGVAEWRDLLFTRSSSPVQPRKLATLRGQFPGGYGALGDRQIAAFDAVVQVAVAGRAQGLVVQARLADNLPQLLGKAVHCL
jgi:hypothetical protein